MEYTFHYSSLLQVNITKAAFGLRYQDQKLQKLTCNEIILPQQ